MRRTFNKQTFSRPGFDTTFWSNESDASPSVAGASAPLISNFPLGNGHLLGALDVGHGRASNGKGEDTLRFHPDGSITTTFVTLTTGDDVYTIGDGSWDVNALSGNDLIKVAPTFQIGATYICGPDYIHGGAGSDTIEITTSNTWYGIWTLTPTESVDSITADGSNVFLVEDLNIDTGVVYGPLDFSQTVLTNIAGILGSLIADDIRGSSGADNINARDGDDTLRESGGSDVIDGNTDTTHSLRIPTQVLIKTLTCRGVIRFCIMDQLGI